MAAVSGVVLAFALALAGCSAPAGGDSGGGGGSDGTLTLGNAVVPASLAPSAAAWANQAPYLQAVYDSLLHETPDLGIEPWLATSWSYNDDKTVLTLKLRDDVTFTDGTPFTADVAAQNLIRFRDGTSSLRSYLALMTSAEAVDAHTLRITLSEPNPALLTYLSGVAGLQASPATFSAADEATHPVGSGPYLLDSDRTVIGSTYVYTRNENYWAPQIQHYGTVVINVYQTTSTQLNAIQSRQVNGVSLLDNSAIAQVEGAGYTTESQVLNFQGLLLFDRDGTITPALKDVRVRRAINHAIDRDAMLKAVGNGLGEPTTQIFRSTDAASYDPALDDEYPYDPAKAKDLLAEAGHPNGFRVTIPQVATGSTALYDLVKQYLGAVGITVDYVNEPPNNLLADVAGAKFSIVASLPLQTDATAWQVANFKLLPKATWNPFHTEDETVTRLAHTVQTGSEEEAARAGKELNRYIVEQAWFAPWYRPQLTFAVDADTSVVVQQDNAYPYLWNITPKS